MFDFFKKDKKQQQVSAEDTAKEPNINTSDHPPVSSLSVPESNVPESNVPESNVPESNVPESNRSESKLSFTERLKRGLSKTRQQLGGQLSILLNGGKIDDAVYEELESILLTSDVGIAATEKLLDKLKARVKKERLEDTVALKGALKSELLAILSPLEIPLETHTDTPFVIMLAGVNGAGKTTSIGKLAKRFQTQGKSVLIAAGDTFRAAAREQLQVWGERNNVHVVASEGADPAAVIFDAVSSAIAKKIDIVIADTAGRLPTQMHLMDEIAKVKRVINKAHPGAPHEVILVLDANTGQNAVSQVKTFDDALGVTGLILSKLDGTAKGGVVAAIAEARPIPIRYIGIGEGIDDLRPFSAKEFIDALFDE